MSRQFSTNRGDHWEVALHLIFDSTGGVRLTRGRPDLSRNERSMELVVKVPHALFRTPTMRASIDIQATETAVAPIDLTAAAEALKLALGVDVDIRIQEVPE
jgi:hypothetical protein